MPAQSPTVSPPGPEGLNSVLDGNIKALNERRKREQRDETFEQKLGDTITRFTGSMLFVYIHLAILVVWVAVNSGLVAALPKFDPTFVILATAASVEAIFLSTFVLISQNRAAKLADQRSDLDLQINLLAEHEITRLVELTSAIANHLGLAEAHRPELEELGRDVAPEAVLERIEDVGRSENPPNTSSR